MPFVPMSIGGMLEYNEGSITGMGYLSLVNTEVNWLLRAFALSRSSVIGLLFTLRVGMPMFSRLIIRMIIEPSNNELSFHGGIRRDEKTSRGNTVLNNVNIVPYIRCVSRRVETRISDSSNATAD